MFIIDINFVGSVVSGLEAQNHGLVLEVAPKVHDICVTASCGISVDCVTVGGSAGASGVFGGVNLPQCAHCSAGSNSISACG